MLDCIMEVTLLVIKSALAIILMSPFVFIERIGSHGVIYIQQIGAWGMFLFRSFYSIFINPFRLHFIVKEVRLIGFDSLSIILFTGFFTGMVVGVEGYHTLVRFASEGALGSGVGYSLLAELGPVLSALLLAGRAGSALCAQIGIMRITEQIDALDCMAIDPYNYLVSPKLAGGLISLPLLTFLFCFMGIIGGYLAGCVILGVNPGSYFNSMMSIIDYTLLRMCFVKAVTFSVLVISICAFKGFTAHQEKEKGALGVSKATTYGVVLSSVAVLLFNYILTTFLI